MVENFAWGKKKEVDPLNIEEITYHFDTKFLEQVNARRVYDTPDDERYQQKLKEMSDTAEIKLDSREFIDMTRNIERLMNRLPAKLQNSTWARYMNIHWDVNGISTFKNYEAELIPLVDVCDKIDDLIAQVPDQLAKNRLFEIFQKMNGAQTSLGQYEQQYINLRDHGDFVVDANGVPVTLEIPSQEPDHTFVGPMTVDDTIKINRLAEDIKNDIDHLPHNVQDAKWAEYTKLANINAGPDAFQELHDKLSAQAEVSNRIEDYIKNCEGAVVKGRVTELGKKLQDRFKNNIGANSPVEAYEDFYDYLISRTFKLDKEGELVADSIEKIQTNIEENLKTLRPDVQKKKRQEYLELSTSEEIADVYQKITDFINNESKGNISNPKNYIVGKKLWEKFDQEVPASATIEEYKKFYDYLGNHKFALDNNRDLIEIPFDAIPKTQSKIVDEIKTLPILAQIDLQNKYNELSNWLVTDESYRDLYDEVAKISELNKNIKAYFDKTDKTSFSQVRINETLNKKFNQELATDPSLETFQNFYNYLENNKFKINDRGEFEEIPVEKNTATNLEMLQKEVAEIASSTRQIHAQIIGQRSEEIDGTHDRYKDTKGYPYEIQKYLLAKFDNEVSHDAPIQVYKDFLNYLKENYFEVNNKGEIEAKQNKEVLYRRILERANEEAVNIDPKLSASIVETIADNFGTKETHPKVVLKFKHYFIPEVTWTMEIDTDEEYLKNSFPEQIVKKYQEKLSEAQNNETIGKKQDKNEHFEVSEEDFEKELANEKPLNQEEIEITDSVNEITNRYRRQYGLDDIDVPEDSLHKIDRKKWNRPSPSSFIERDDFKAIIIQESSNNLVFAKHLIHEMFHFKTSNKFPRWLNEAMIEKMTMKAMRDITKNPIFDKQLARTKKVRSVYEGDNANDGSPLFTKDTFAAYLDNKKRPVTINYINQEERKDFDDLLDDIAKQNPNKFKNAKVVFDEFVKAATTGDITELESVLGPNLRKLYKDELLDAQDEADDEEKIDLNTPTSLINQATPDNETEIIKSDVEPDNENIQAESQQAVQEAVDDQPINDQTVVTPDIEPTSEPTSEPTPEVIPEPNPNSTIDQISENEESETNQEKTKELEEAEARLTANIEKLEGSFKKYWEENWKKGKFDISKEKDDLKKYNKLNKEVLGIIDISKNIKDIINNKNFGSDKDETIKEKLLEQFENTSDVWASASPKAFNDYIKYLEDPDVAFTLTEAEKLQASKKFKAWSKERKELNKINKGDKSK